jgi:hypothetical protein
VSAGATPAATQKGAAATVGHGQEGAALRDIGRWLTCARPQDYAHVSALLDTLHRRGLPDHLALPLRRRLARVKPPHPLSLRRVLFVPLDPLLLDAPRWRRGEVGIPRTAIRPIAAQVEQALGDLAESLEAELAGIAPDDDAAIRALGRRLWPLAAPIVAEAAAPADWQHATGLRPADHFAIARVVGAVLKSANDLDDLIGSGITQEERIVPAMRRIVARAAGSRSGALPPDPMIASSLVVIVLGQLKLSERLLVAAAEFCGAHADAAGRRAADQAIEFMLDAVEYTAAHGPEAQARALASRHGAAIAVSDEGLAAALPAATTQLRRIVTLLDAIGAHGPAQRPSMRSRTEDLRRAMDTMCRSRFEQEASDHALAAAMLANSETSTADLQATEAAMRELRVFETVARRLGGPDHYDRVLRKTAAQIGALQAAPLIDRVRLVEILVGPEAALALL